MSKLLVAQIESSDDELPEEVAFDASKSAALKKVKDALEAVKREKNLLKEKRKKRQQLFQEQKKRKLLPQQLLKEFDKQPQKKTDQSEKSVEKGINKNVSTKPSFINKDKEWRTKATRKKAPKNLPDSYKVTRIKDESASKSLQKKAMGFIKSRLYGKGTNRTTNAELLSLSKKRGASQGAAVDFANKQSGAYKKAKMARSNKRFIRKQRPIPF